MTFSQQVWRVVRKIPKGRVATYGQVAAMLDRPQAARAVGTAMRECPTGVPWHRVVNAAGRISRRARASGMLTQKMLLEREGIRLRRGRVVLGRHRWNGTGGTHATRFAPELLGRESEARSRQGPRGRTPRFRFDLDR